MRAVILAVTASLLVQGAAADAVTGNDAATLSKNVWQFDAAGNATHVQSQWQCPAKIGDMLRERIGVFGSNGTDTSCEYRFGSIYVTLYLTLAPTTAVDGAFDGMKDALTKHYQDAKPLPGAEQTTFDAALPFRHFVYAAANGQIDSGVWLADLHGWLFEIRADYAPRDQTAAFAWLKSTVASMLDVPGRHLDACSKASPVTRNGREITDPAKLMMLTIGMAGDADEKIARPEAVPDEWCVEQASGNVAFWRNLGGDQHLGILDRLTVGADDKQDTIEIRRNAIGDLLLSLDGSVKAVAPTYLVQLTQNDTVFVVAFYQGRPDAPALVELARGVLSGKRQALISHKLGSKGVTITLPAK
jgi:hypothetical protein